MPLQSRTSRAPKPPFQIFRVANPQSDNQPGLSGNNPVANSSNAGPQREKRWKRVNMILNQHDTLVSLILGIGFGIWGIILTIRYGESQDQLKELRKIVSEQQDMNRCFSLFIEQQSVTNDKLFSLDSLSRDQLKVLEDARSMTVQESRDRLLAFCRDARFRFAGPNAEFGKIYVAGNMNGANEGDCSRYYELANALEPFLKEMRSQNALYLQKNPQANRYWQQNIRFYSIQRNTGGCPTLKEREKITLDLYEAEKNWDHLIEILN